MSTEQWAFWYNRVIEWEGESGGKRDREREREREGFFFKCKQLDDNNNNNKAPSSYVQELLQSIGAECEVGPRLTLVVSTPGVGNGSSEL